MTKVNSLPVDRKTGVWNYCEKHKIGFYHECPHCRGKQPKEDSDKPCFVCGGISGRRWLYEVAESIPEKPFVLDTEKTEVEVTIRPEMKEIEVQSEDVAVSEEVVPAEQPTDGEPEAEENVTDSKIIDDIEAQIAALEAKKAELEE